MSKLRITWAMHNEVIAMGNAFGYTAASVNMRDAMLRRGDVEIDDDAPIAVHLCHPWTYRPDRRPFQRNVHFTMYELDPCPPEFPATFGQSDAILAPCRWVADLFKKTPLPEGVKRPPILVSPLGFDPERYPIVDREPPAATEDDPFVWLWIGAANERKGFKVLTEEWFAFKDFPWMLLYMKTTRHDPTTGAARSFRKNNVIYDERMLPRADLHKLYSQAHGFVFPSFGEGFGLTSLEASATGLPQVTIKHSGMADFLADRSGVRFVPFEPFPVGTSQGHRATGARTLPGQLGQSMIDVMRNYRVYRQEARRGAVRLHNAWTWDHAAEKLVRNLRELEGLWKRQRRGQRAA